MLSQTVLKPEPHCVLAVELGAKALLSTDCSISGVLQPHSQYESVFLIGLYWPVMGMRPRLNEYHLLLKAMECIHISADVTRVYNTLQEFLGRFLSTINYPTIS